MPNPFGIAFPLTLAAFNDTLYAGGDYPYTGPFSHLLKFNGTSWVTVGGPFSGPVWSSTKKLFIFNGQLIAGGKFTTINYNPINNIAVWNGKSWNSLGDGLNYVVAYLAEYNGNLYASGGFTASGNNNSVKYIAKWNGNNWSPINNSHIFKSSGPLITYNNSLIIGSVNDTIAGIPMQGIAKWDGITFTSMGSSLIKYVFDFWIFNNELYLAGATFNSNPLSQNFVVLKWNGNSWIQIGGIFNNSILALEDYNNQIFAAGFYTLPNSPISRFITITNVSKEEVCNYLEIHPNPATNLFTFNAPEIGNLQILNNVGQIVAEILINTGNNKINVRSLSNGLYILNFQTKKQLIKSKLVIYK